MSVEELKDASTASEDGETEYGGLTSGIFTAHAVLFAHLAEAAKAIESGALTAEQAANAMRDDFGLGYVFRLGECCAWQHDLKPFGEAMRPVLVGLYAIVLGSREAETVVGRLQGRKAGSHSDEFRRGMGFAEFDSKAYSSNTFNTGMKMTSLRKGLILWPRRPDALHWLIRPLRTAEMMFQQALSAARSQMSSDKDDRSSLIDAVRRRLMWLLRSARQMLRPAHSTVTPTHPTGGDSSLDLICAVLLLQLREARTAVEKGELSDSVADAGMRGPFGEGYLAGLLKVYLDAAALSMESVEVGRAFTTLLEVVHGPGPAASEEPSPPGAGEADLDQDLFDAGMQAALHDHASFSQSLIRGDRSATYRLRDGLLGELLADDTDGRLEAGSAWLRPVGTGDRAAASELWSRLAIGLVH